MAFLEYLILPYLVINVEDFQVMCVESRLDTYCKKRLQFETTITILPFFRCGWTGDQR